MIKVTLKFITQNTYTVINIISHFVWATTQDSEFVWATTQDSEFMWATTQDSEFMWATTRHSEFECVLK